MKNITRVFFVGVPAFLIAFLWGVYALFHGSFDNGKFEIEQSEWSASREIAIVGRRSDHQALSGDQYFVALADHPFSSKDLRHAYYYDGLTFRAGSDCLTIQWMNDHRLAVECKNGSIHVDQIAVQKTQIGDVTVLYRNIPIVGK